MAEELKPCPFCGETPGADSYAHADGGCKYGAISCSCGVIGPDVRTGYKKWPEWRDSAITAWNERAVPAGHVVVPQELLERIRSQLDLRAEFDPTYPPEAHPVNDDARLFLELRALLSEQEGGRQ
ncbi:TPA: Lar family restriction alleviation protein [Pseudomonas aeruginosa]|uniref:Lar family restriction alleviation protein n=1 Tax=Pseudomonas aeruginosa TaxID=287 RepID=UPI001ADF594C|nr:Lar family restriction alleviation protein [Pseudomonas aeruginosa]UAC81926.1 Lar family restriction alleviation protein [Pseudomonas aeruginosa]HCF6051232.1 Lar family restriction alleviation protein [Pseudomonas aeruginosa]HCI1891764.1 Lar family restriction alleviation protein [Pseudomonas aeruginosa]HCI1996736.1 Lar family restriction alleviation protein [Pseudomonas aeruginosa]HCI2252500.1 Lar family restriction alleviation protein [Pseudomonas aeruginosa]